MRNVTLMAFLIMAASLILVSDSFAQLGGKGYGRGEGCIQNLNLTDAQKEKVSDLRLTHQEEMIKLRADLDLKELELQAKFKNTDVNRSGYISGVNEISALKNKIAEAKANHQMDVYELLDDDQKKEFMSSCPGFGKGQFGRMGQGEGREFRKMHKMRRG